MNDSRKDGVFRRLSRGSHTGLRVVVGAPLNQVYELPDASIMMLIG